MVPRNRGNTEEVHPAPRNHSMYNQLPFEGPMYRDHIHNKGDLINRQILASMDMQRYE